ncbi:hypothetical protein [Aeromonas sp. R2-3]|uniref:hypothetical protein n=1 Tax=Aeromonas sp. R2-3 TaxID=3138461 RepID=UPI0034A12894
MKKHGNEPWSSVEVTNDEDQLIKIRASNGANIARIMIDADDKYFSDEQRENARRIVACVNACRGLTADELEQKGLVAAVGTQLLEGDQLGAELLAALTLSLEQMEVDAIFIDGEYNSSRDLDELEQDGDLPNAILVARAAIAKAKGGAA